MNDHTHHVTLAVSIDQTNGLVYVRLETGGAGDPYSVEVMRLRGLETLIAILQTFSPSPSVLGFRVPYMPEGMAAADHFDTYCALAHSIDFTQAHPLQCGYPATPPHVGDYLTAADTVPTPAPGQGVYYVTAATYQGATRYGCQSIGGHMSGRDPALLPVCGP